MKNKIYKVLYYISFILTVALFIYCNNIAKQNDVLTSNVMLTTLIILSVLSFIVSNVFIFKNSKQKTSRRDFVLPIIYIVFIIITVMCSLEYNKDAIIPYIHYLYYYTYLLIPYIFINLYTIALFKKK